MKRKFWVRSLGLTGIATLAVGLVAVHAQSVASKQPFSTWSDFGGSAASLQYSSLRQINKTNVTNLRQAWFAPAPGPARTFPFSPLVVGNVMYVVGGAGPSIMALDKAIRN